MATYIAFLAIALLAGACYFVYARSMDHVRSKDDNDLKRFMIANRELHLEKIDRELWDTAMKISHGDEGVARARYVDLRVQQMKNQEEQDAANKG